MRRWHRLIMVSGLALALGACMADDVDPLAGVTNKVEHPLPTKVVDRMQAYGMSVQSPIMMRIFKEESVLEVWKAKVTGRYEKIAEYEICKWSGGLGPKVAEGDRQAPEGFYAITPAQMNPNSSYYLSFNLGYPNRFDRAHGRTGTHLMVHGACSSAGCYSMSDEQVLEIYAFAREAFKGGQPSFQVQALPFRMTAENMARHRDNPHNEFWKMLKVGYDHFELTNTPPKVDVCDRRYVFNQVAGDEGMIFDPVSACPQTATPASLQIAYSTYVRDYEKAFQEAVEKQAKGASNGALAALMSKPAEGAEPVAVAIQAAATAVLPAASAPASPVVASVSAEMPSPAAVAEPVAETVPIPTAAPAEVSAVVPQPVMPLHPQADGRPFWKLWSRN